MKKRTKRLRRLACLTVLLTFMFAFSTVVFAESSYIAKWADYIEANEPAYTDSWTFHDIKDAIEVVLETGRQAMEDGDYEAARLAGNDGYYGYYDLAFENATSMYISGSRVSEMELLFSRLQTIAKNQGDPAEYSEAVDTIEANLEEDANYLDGADLDGESSGGSTSDSSDTAADTSSTTTSASAATLVFLGCFSIILREGFEAIIVVGAIIAYLQVKVKAGEMEKKRALYPVYFGSLLGIVCSFIMAWLLNVLRMANSANQEMIEGITCLIAVCVLFYVCNWMLHRSETEAWSAYIQERTETGSKNGSIFALAFTAWLSVFREGAEVVLFFQPYMSDEATRGSVWAGLIVGLIALVFVYLIIRLFSVKLPMRIFFNATSVLLAVMCVCFLGSGIKELIEAGVFGSYTVSWLSWIPYNDVLDVLGIYPLLNTIVPQIILAVVLIILFHIGFKQNRAIRTEADKKRAEQEAKEAAERQAKEDAERRAFVRGIVTEVLAEKGLISLPAGEEKPKA